ncbi:gluconate 2-dehydrogenase subunit 3 family protein [Sorangium sp. So ce341]|uniref:gluconate 2-dehydrogenase subunit 3 family protein n=1 Tax=Sorangium sp. So ce341 TaxID=3133302 RepID=UPI003F5E7680
MSELVAHLPVVCLVIALAALAAAAAVGLARRASAPGAPARALSVRERAIVAACADALFPAGGPIPLSGTEAGLVEYMERYVARTPRPLRPYMRLLLHFVELSPCVFGPRRARFTRLAQADRIAVLASMSQSCIYLRRVTFLSLRTMLSMGYLANEKVARAIGVACCPTPFERRAAARAPGEPVAVKPQSLAPGVTA